jgi:phage terminase large subunit GpA-like protein
VRNEALDCLVLAYTALRLLNPKLDLWMEHIERVAASGSPTASPSAGGTSAPARRPRPRRFAYSPYLMSEVNRGSW